MNWLGIFLLSILRPALGLIILAGLLIYWVLNKKLPKERCLRIVFFIFSGIIIIRSLVLTFLNYWLWSQQPITDRLLPPHSPISYIIRYSWQHYWFEPIMTVLLAFIVFWGIYLFNKKFQDNLFYDEEKYLAALGILTVGWPNCLFYLCLVLFLGVINHSILCLFNLIRGANNSLRKVSRRPNGQGLSTQIGSQRRRGDVVEKTVAQAERARFLSEAKKSEAERERSDLAGVGHSVFSKQLSEPLRLSLLYFWLPCALLILFLSDIINKYIGITQLII